GFTYYMETPRQNKYRVSVWSSQPAASIKYKLDSSPESIASVNNVGKAGNWYLLEADIAVTATNASKLELWCEAGVNTTYFDDFRVRPIDAAMTGYVYNPWGEVSHILDNNNLYTEYRYDAMGRLTSTYKESFKAAYGNQGIVKTGIVEYNYGVNNPYTLTINTSSTGTRGYIYPSGNISVAQGKDLRFELRDKCQSNTLAAVWIDGKKIDVDKSSVTLADGTTVSIQNAGKVVTFKNVQTAHTLKADFASNSVAGVVVCNGYTDGNGNTCFDGGYRYAYYDLCGNQGSWMTANKKSEIPYDLRSLAVDNCCQYNNGLVSGCNCKPGSTGIE
ncbi:MAG TPA: RHS repeat domain-containing protein, partial [Ohtaekwangia sp.]|uniref:RHS repeat domain-containing protein n=1 Tax=Ohtaekwangia sp. TaxID=2066019 RepID=UPI002F93079E